MIFRAILKVTAPVGYCNETIAHEIRNKAIAARKNIPRYGVTFILGHCHFRFGQSLYPQTLEQKTDLIVYRRVLSEVFGCPFRTMEETEAYYSKNTTIRPNQICIEIKLKSEY